MSDADWLEQQQDTAPLAQRADELLRLIFTSEAFTRLLIGPTVRDPEVFGSWRFVICAGTPLSEVEEQTKCVQMVSHDPTFLDFLREAVFKRATATVGREIKAYGIDHDRDELEFAKLGFSLWSGTFEPFLDRLLAERDSAVTLH